MTTRSSRAELLGNALASIVGVNRLMTLDRRVPFEGIQLGRGQLDLLFFLSRSPDPMTPGALARTLGVTPGAVTQLVDGLRDVGLVDVSVNPDDARSRILTLTESARDRVVAFERGITERMLVHFARLDDSELATLGGLLSRVEGIV